jgi:cytochrome P450
MKTEKNSQIKKFVMNVTPLFLKDMVCVSLFLGGPGVTLKLIISLDTTSAALGWSFYLISTHPEVEAKVMEEIESILGDKQYPSFEDLKNMKYLDMCLKEALRLYPSVPTIARLTTEDTKVGDHIIPKGVCIFIIF